MCLREGVLMRSVFRLVIISASMTLLFACKKDATSDASKSSSMFSLSSNSNHPKIVSDLLFGEPFENLTKKYGAFEVDNRDVVACKTPPKCDYYYIQQKMINSCLWRGMNAQADQKTGKIKWAYLAMAGKCSGIIDNENVSKFVSKNDPKPDYLYLNRGMAFATWETGGIYMNIVASCVNPETNKTASNFLDCKLMQINIREEGITKPEFKTNNFKFL